MKVYEKVTPVQNELNEIRKNNLTLRQKNLELQEENSVLTLEKEKLNNIKDSKILTLEEKLNKLEIENNKLTEINAKNDELLKDYVPKIGSYNEIYDKYKRLASENEKLMENSIIQNNLILSIKKEKEELLAKFDLNRLEGEAMRNDKLYLSKESMHYAERLKDAQDKVNSLETELKETKRISNNYLEKLTEKNCNLDNAYEEKLKSELNDMKNKYNKDLESLKKLYENLSDKRCAYLQEERDDYKHKCIAMEKIIKDKTEANEFLHTELRVLRTKTEEEISYLKIQNKFKSEELDRTQNLHEENIGIIKLLKSENESFRDKTDLLKTEIIKKEANHKEEMSHYRAELNIQKEKIANYEHIESELDKVIVESHTLGKEDQEVMNIIKDIPTSSKRRISQCLVLANKLKLNIIEIEKLKDLNKKLENEIRLLSDERDLYRGVADRSKQP
jgi:hypothetical protein